MSTRVLFALIPLIFTVACSDRDTNDPQLPGIDVDTTEPDVAVAPDTGPDAPDSPVTPGGPRVEIDLSAHLPAPTGTQTARVYELQSDDAPFSGQVVAARTGDWILENDLIRVAIEGDKRVMSPCPWGGTPIDAAYLAGGSDEDILGETCALINGGLSFRPQTFEVLHDGADGGAAVLAASGELVINDFLNLPAMAGEYIPGFGERIAVDVNQRLPLRVTTYYILAPGQTHLRTLMAFRNDSPDPVHTLALFLVASGGDGYYFNPMSSTNGFGAGSTDLGVSLDNLPFIAFNGETASYAFAPDPNPALASDPLPLSGSYIIISGVSAIALGVGAHEIISVLTSGPEALAQNERAMHVDPYATTVLGSRLFVGSGSLDTMVDPIYAAHEVTTGTIEGIVRDTDGDPVPGARVTALRRGFRAMNQAISGPDGRFSMTVPPESYELKARRGSWAPDGVAAVTVNAGATVDAGVVGVLEPGVLRVNVTTPDDGCSATTGAVPVPARLTVICDGACVKPSTAEADTGFHRLPEQFQTVIYGAADGVIEAELPAGDYRILVSRGLEWSVWPPDGLNAAHPISVAPGGLVEVDAEIARVVDTGTAYSGDFHVHSIISPDSTVAYGDRVANFGAEGVDLLVSTDHDAISDHRPYVTELALDPWMQAIVGEEITTADLGHFNAFPLVMDPRDARGGAIDWGNGEGDTFVPADLYAAIDAAAPGDQVIQVNHPDGLGLIVSLKADVLRGITYGDREMLRLPPQTAPGKTAEDTGLWSDGFTAMEIMNGSSRDRFYRIGRWWMQMIGRGFSPTGTAVTDTHKLYSDLGGAPRTYVFGGIDASCGDRKFGALADYDEFVTKFTMQVNAGNAVGTNGPFFEVWVDGDGVTPAMPGQTATTAGAPFTAHVSIQTPEWIRASDIDVYLNPRYADVETLPGEQIPTPIPATTTVPLSWDEAAHLVTVKSGAVEHKVWQQTVDIPLESAEDAFLIIVVRGSQSMAPVTMSAPFGFANPIFIDADGGGYNNPPYAALAAAPPGPGDLPPGPTPPPREPVSPSELIGLVRQMDCHAGPHGHGDGHAH